MVYFDLISLFRGSNARALLSPICLQELCAFMVTNHQYLMMRHSCQPRLQPNFFKSFCISVTWSSAKPFQDNMIKMIILTVWFIWFTYDLILRNSIDFVARPKLYTDGQPAPIHDVFTHQGLLCHDNYSRHLYQGVDKDDRNISKKKFKEFSKQVRLCRSSTCEAIYLYVTKHTFIYCN